MTCAPLSADECIDATERQEFAKLIQPISYFIEAAKSLVLYRPLSNKAGNNSQPWTRIELAVVKWAADQLPGESQNKLMRLASYQLAACKYNRTPKAGVAVYLDMFKTGRKRLKRRRRQQTDSEADDDDSE